MGFKSYLTPAQPYQKPIRKKRQPPMKTVQPENAHTDEPINMETVHAVPVVAETKGDPYLPATTSVDPLPVSVTVADELPLAVRDPLLDEDALVIEPKRPQGTRTLTNSEIAWILKLRGDGLTQEQIGNRLNTSQRTVSKYLRMFGDPATTLVKGYVETNALDIVKDVLATGEGKDKLEVLDRAGVLEKKEKGSGGGVTINIGDADKVGVQINNSRWE